MTRPRGLLRRRVIGLVLIVALFAAACDRGATPPPPALEPGEVRTFTGTWSAAGNRQTMDLGSDHQAVIFRLTGSLLLSGAQRLKRGFQADVIGFADNQTGLQARSVWTDERGDKVFSELRAPGMVSGQLIEGRFLGGTGRFTGVSGEYTFRWKRLIDTEDGEISGRVVDLKGWARLAAPSTPETGIGQPQ